MVDDNISLRSGEILFVQVPCSYGFPRYWMQPFRCSAQSACFVGNIRKMRWTLRSAGMKLGRRAASRSKCTSNNTVHTTFSTTVTFVVTCPILFVSLQGKSPVYTFLVLFFHFSFSFFLFLRVRVSCYLSENVFQVYVLKNSCFG